MVNSLVATKTNSLPNKSNQWYLVLRQIHANQDSKQKKPCQPSSKWEERATLFGQVCLFKDALWRMFEKGYQKCKTFDAFALYHKEISVSEVSQQEIEARRCAKSRVHRWHFKTWRQFGFLSHQVHDLGCQKARRGWGNEWNSPPHLLAEP